MARLSYNKERFTKVNKYDAVNDSYTGILAASKFNQKNGQDYKLLDVIDVDFNGTWFKPTQSYINNADEFFAAMESLDKTKDLAYISKQIEDITSSYITRSEFESIIGNYQGALNYGDHIAIVDDNTLIAYDVISNSQLYEFSTAYVSYSYLADTTYTKAETNELIASKISELIGGADEAFDTMQEISEWIMNQTTFVEVPYDQIDTTSGNKYYIYNTQTGKYEQVDKEYIESHPDETYYEILSLLDEINSINNKIGYVKYETGVGYTYSGIMQDLHNLEIEDKRINNRISDISDILEQTVITANIAVNRADTAYNIAYSSYLKSEEAIDIALSTIDKSDIAYEIAYGVRIEVGHPSQKGYFRPFTDEEKALLNDGDSVYVYDQNTNTYSSSIYNSTFSDVINYCTWEDPIEATGLHGVSEYTQKLASTALYNLNNDTTEQIPGYVTLDITPTSYDGDPHRTIKLTAIGAEYSIDDMKIHKDGLITAYQFNEILSYALSWEKIG